MKNFFKNILCNAQSYIGAYMFMAGFLIVFFGIWILDGKETAKKWATLALSEDLLDEVF